MRCKDEMSDRLAWVLSVVYQCLGSEALYGLQKDSPSNKMNSNAVIDSLVSICHSDLVARITN